jgi:glycosyltransferase involved in cell wall biosynthesis
MKILHVSYSDIKGGAAIAANRLHNGFLKKKFNSWLLVNEKISKDKKIIGFTNIYDLFVNLIKKLFIKTVNKVLRHKVGEFYSLNYFRSKTLERINIIKPDIINLHWVNNEMISIEEIAQIKQPFFWTIVDMWPFSGVEHYNQNSNFLKKNKFSFSTFINENTLKRKKLFYKTNFKVIAISNWLAKEAKKSFLFKNKIIYTIPLGLDFNIWKPINKTIARNHLNFNEKKKYILFSSTNGTKDFRKGFDVFLKTIDLLKIDKNLLHLIIIGKSEHKSFLYNKISYTEFKKNFFLEPKELIKIYSACDLLVAPSLLEAFGQVALEAASCNLPTVAFDNTGIADIIRHKKTGYLAKFLDIEDFAKGVDWFLKDNNKINNNNIRNYVKNKFSIDHIVNKYKHIYSKILQNNEHRT